jgi:rubrerythrin
MQLDALLERSRQLEERAAAVYRSFAAAARDEAPLCALWTSLAREEEEHARSIARARERREATEGWRTRLDGWEEALAEVDRALTAAERLDGRLTPAQQLGCALDLEMSELEALRRTLLAATHQPCPAGQEQHALRLAESAAELSDDPHVRLKAALLRARARLKERP